MHSLAEHSDKPLKTQYAYVCVKRVSNNFTRASMLLRTFISENNHYYI